MIRHLRLLALAALFCTPRFAGAVVPYIPDPVEELRQVLRTPVRDPGNQDELVWRQNQLRARAKALGIGDLRRALLLQEWRHEDREGVANIDKPVRDSIVDRLVKDLRKVLRSNYVPAKLAGISQIGEMGVAVFGAGHTSLAGTLAPELAKLMNDPNPAVRQAAAYAIGRINPDPKLASVALGRLLGSDDPADRLAAADGLLILLRTTNTVRHNTGPNRLIITADQVALIDRSVIQTAGPGLSDSSSAVRTTCAEALQSAAALLTDMVGDVPRLDFPPPGRKPSEDEQALIDGYRKDVEDERNLLLPVAQALADQGRALRRALEDQVPQVRLVAARTLEEIGQARIKLLRKAASVPSVEGIKEPAKEKTEAPPVHSEVVLVAAQAVAQKPLPLPKPIPKVEGIPDPLLDVLRLALPTLADRALSDPVPQVRLASVDALETLGPEAAPAVPALARTLLDCNVFVRWASARALSKVGPVNTSLTVPILARLLSDPDLDVERAAANTLGIYGPKAAGAIPALADAIAGGDPERRIDMIHTLVAIGDAATSAIPAITRALDNPNVRVRRSAADALGHFGAASRSAIPALEKVLNDPDGEVRKAATDSLLAITASEE